MIDYCYRCGKKTDCTKTIFLSGHWTITEKLKEFAVSRDKSLHPSYAEFCKDCWKEFEESG